MEMEDYKKRYIIEYDELVIRYLKLNSIIQKAENSTLEFKLNCPLDLLKKQSEIMWSYIETLWDRSVYEKIDLIPISKNAIS